MALAWKLAEDQAIGQQLMDSSATQKALFGREVEGKDDFLGIGEFIYVVGTGTINAGDVVELANVVDGTTGLVKFVAQQWAGTANKGKILGVALVALTGSLYGWVQVSGNAVVNSNGVTAAGDAAYWEAAGVVSSTAVAGKQVLGMTCVSAANANVGVGSSQYAIGANSSLYVLNDPHGQSAIT